MHVLTTNQRNRFSAALKRLDGDEDTLVMLAGMVAEDAPTMLERLGCEIEAKQLSDVASVGHALKGLLSTFETSAPVSELQLVIDAARRGDAQVATSLYVEVRPSLDKLVVEVRELGVV